MNTSHDTRDKLTPDPVFRSQLDIITWIVMGLQILVALVAYPLLPDTVPIHWDINGQANGYGSKWIDTFLFPLISIGIYVLLRLALKIGPRLGGNDSLIANSQVRDVLLAAIIVFMLIVQLVATTSAMGLQFDAILIINLGISLLFLILGNYMGKLRRNFWMGIRTPWTLVSEVVWERTHRVGGWLFVAIGVLGVLFSFLPMVRLWGLVVLSVLAVVFLFIYSYVCYRQQYAQSDEPFDNGDRT